MYSDGIKKSIFAWFFVSCFYLALAGASGVPIRCDVADCWFEWKYAWITAFLFVVLLLYINQLPRKIYFYWAILLISVLLMSFHLSYSSRPVYVLGVLYSYFFGTLFGSAFLILLVTHVGHDSIYRFLSGFFCAICLITFAYKGINGHLLDRNADYFLNGSIVFGWLMGLGFLCSLFVYLEKMKTSNLLVTILLFVGLVLSYSKGPIMAVALSSFAYLVVVRKFDKKTILAIGVILVILLYLGNMFFDQIFVSSRLNIREELLRVEGSVGIRSYVWSVALDLIYGNLIFGIGAGNFSNYIPVVKYAHNIHLEVLLEYGLLAFSFYIVFLSRAFIGTDGRIKVLVLFMVVSLTFSGNFGYSRYIWSFVILALLLKSQRQRL